MELEKFPSNETALKMLGTVSNGFYDDSYIGKWLFQVMGLEMEDARRIVEELPYQAFPETATWGLRYHEQKYNLPVRENLPYEERRKYIFQKRDTRTPMNPYRMEVILGSILGRKVHVDDESGSANTFMVKVEPGDNAADVSAAIQKLKAVKQSHVAFTVRFTCKAYLEIGSKTEKFKMRYTRCGTVPMVSRGLKYAGTNVQAEARGIAVKKIFPISGNSGRTGMYPKISRGLKVANVQTEVYVTGIGYGVKYPETSDSQKTGTSPMVSRRAIIISPMTELVPGIKAYRFRNHVSGTQPMVSRGFIESCAENDIEAMTEAQKTEYRVAGETKTGTIPKISTGSKQTGKSVIPEVETESYQVRYPLCGNTFEI